MKKPKESEYHHLIGGTEISHQREGISLREHRHKLEVVEGPDKGLEMTISKQRILIGTLPDCDFRLRDPLVSRRHCQIEVLKDRYLLKDLGSTNGTKVNDISIINAYLSPGAYIQIGETSILFRPKKRWVKITPERKPYFGELIGESIQMREIFGLLAKVAPTDLSVVLCGETGTGKELAAQAIHQHSKRKANPFVVVDCGAISPTLIESELFGHERGAFTGAIYKRKGAFVEANKGTLFLDEISTLPLEIQPKLLRAIEHKEVKAVGEDRYKTVDVRIICATNEDLISKIKNCEFREDLFYRLNEITITLPPLREHLEDIPCLAAKFLEEFGKDPSLILTKEVISYLKSYSWPGNIRELKNYIRQMTLIASDKPLNVELLPPFFQQEELESPNINIAYELPFKEAKKIWTRPYKKKYLIRLLEKYEGDLELASKKAGIHRKSLERLLREFNIKT
jgi:DNA-binding NtrC family response regulator